MGSNSVSPGQPTNTTQTAAAVKAALQSQIEGAELSAKLNAMLGIGTFITAEDMFAFAQSQLMSTDAEIRTHVAGISVAKEKAAAMQEISGGLRSIKNGSYSQQKAKLDELIAKANQAGAPELADKLEGMKTTLINKGQAVSADYIEGKAQEVDAEMTKLTSSTELTMIRIQGLMQHRSQILQLASNVIAALNEPAKNAIGNLRGS